MSISTLIRVTATALVLSTLSFAAGVAGDLSMADPPNYGERVVLRLPPDLPGDTVRAGPLPQLISTATASAETPRSRFTPIRFSRFAAEPLAKPPGAQALLQTGKMRAPRLVKPPLRRKGG